MAYSAFLERLATYLTSQDCETYSVKDAEKWLQSYAADHYDDALSHAADPY